MCQSITVSWEGEDATITESREFFPEGKFCDFYFS